MRDPGAMTSPALHFDGGETSLVAYVRELHGPVDPIGLVAAARRRGAPACYWESADRGLAIGAVGTAWTGTASGPERFRAAATALASLRAGAKVEADCDWLRSPLLLAGFAFADRNPAGAPWRDFAAAHLMLPALCVVRRGERAALVRNVVRGAENSAEWGDLADAAGESHLPRVPPRIVSREAMPSPEVWMSAVGETIAAIRAGELDKVVLARACRLQAEAPFDLEAILRRLSERENGCAIFSFAGGSADFVGATPETLASLHGGELKTVALAGTAPRGATAEHDLRLRAALATSEKERREHELVVRGIRGDLGSLVHSLEVDGPPQVVALRRLHHLRTSLRGRVAPHRGILDIAAALHPSPAVGGYPKDGAATEIERREHFERGWYAGPLGWTDLDGSGELAVGLRSAVVHGRDAWLYAGAGIVRDSDPRAELLETELKLRPMLAALGVGE